jgi:D-alanyl-D-alanine carboxypeptidase (penicillin-binding protein 5/6)
MKSKLSRRKIRRRRKIIKLVWNLIVFTLIIIFFYKTMPFVDSAIIDVWVKDQNNSEISVVVENNQNMDIEKPMLKKFTINNPKQNKLDISAESAMLIDADTGEILYDKKPTKKIYPASTTKILTALVALEYGKLDDKIIVRDEANLVQPGSSVAGLDYGESITLEEALKGLMIPSGNDAAYVIAKYIGEKNIKEDDINSSVKYCVDVMNSYVDSFGLKSSHFVNPDGYHHNKHYSCAYDIALITWQAMKNEKFRQIVSIPLYEMDDYKQYNELDPKVRKWENTNKLVVNTSDFYYKFATGVKTGHTDEAGYCLVSSATKNGKSVIAVVFNCTEDGRFIDSIKLLDYGLNSFNIVHDYKNS